MKANKHKLAIAILALSLTQAVSAVENKPEPDTENKNTYWGIGIGSVLGAVVAGPPGAAIGATLGGSIGWGKDSHDALDENISELEQHELVLEQSSQELMQNRISLKTTEQELLKLKRSNAQQALRLKALQETKTTREQNNEFLKKLVGHYAQDIYFQSGQSETPHYAQERLASLVELLKAHPDLRVTLKGFTDATGSAKLNAALAQARVDGIKEALKTQGIDESRISGLAIGEVDHATTIATPVLADAAPENDFDVDQFLLSEDETLHSELRVTASIKPVMETVKSKSHVLDRRVSIELSVVDSNETAVISNLAALENSGAEQ